MLSSVKSVIAASAKDKDCRCLLLVRGTSPWSVTTHTLQLKAAECWTVHRDGDQGKVAELFTINLERVKGETNPLTLCKSNFWIL